VLQQQQRLQRLLQHQRRLRRLQQQWRLRRLQQQRRLQQLRLHQPRLLRHDLLNRCSRSAGRALYSA
jgi:hypothetical protein